MNPSLALNSEVSFFAAENFRPYSASVLWPVSLSPLCFWMHPAAVFRNKTYTFCVNSFIKWYCVSRAFKPKTTDAGVC